MRANNYDLRRDIFTVEMKIFEYLRIGYLYVGQG